MERLAMPGSIGIPGLQAIMRDPGDFGIYQRMRDASLDELIEAGCVIIGSAQSVADQLAEIVSDFHIGHIMTMLQLGSMSRELAIENIDRFADGVLPRLRELHGEDFENHWWPERLGGTAPVGSGQETRPLARI
jgi:alkanesulfonate monooxygenase SsuD/methylene tetrahydromethanopterin reductase-like flavin-dependent oxidoreductase (luciferase family)